MQKEKSGSKYLREIYVLFDAGVGVVLTRTREPMRVIDILHQDSADKRTEFHYWTVRKGWCTKRLVFEDDNSKVVTQSDDKVNLVDALNTLEENNEWKDTINALYYPHFDLGDKHSPIYPVLIQTMKDLVQSFVDTSTRLVLVAPPGFTLPSELEDDIPILDLDTPVMEEYVDSYKQLIERNVEVSGEESMPDFTDEEIVRMASCCAGMTEQEFETAVSRAFVENSIGLHRLQIDDLIKYLMVIKTDIVKRSEILELIQPDEIRNVGGMDVLKKWLFDHVICFTPEAQEFGVSLPKGIAIVGIPGTGKSLIGEAAADVFKMPLIRLDVSRLFNSYVGQSEANTRAALKLLESMSPCVCLIDEIDKAFDSGALGGDNNVSTKVFGILLTWMQRNTAPVFLIVTANDVTRMKAEFFRSGRLDQIFSVTFPNAKERMEVLKIHLRKRKQDPERVNGLDYAVENSEGYVSAELESSVKEAVRRAFVEKLKITGDLIVQELREIKPWGKAFKEQADRIQSWCEQNAKNASVVKGVSEPAKVVKKARKIGLGG